jgi:hypothetical protein
LAHVVDLDLCRVGDILGLAGPHPLADESQPQCVGFRGKASKGRGWRDRQSVESDVPGIASLITILLRHPVLIDVADTRFTARCLGTECEQIRVWIVGAGLRAGDRRAGAGSYRDRWRSEPGNNRGGTEAERGSAGGCRAHAPASAGM